MELCNKVAEVANKQSGGGSHRVGWDVCVGMGAIFKKIGYWFPNTHFEASHWFRKQYPGT